MHELVVCQGLIRQVEQLANEHAASRVECIALSIGPLSGIEPELLDRAFRIAREETVAEFAELDIETGPVVVECRVCSASGEVSANRLLCPSCGGWQVNVIRGDELLLLHIEIGRTSTSA